MMTLYDVVLFSADVRLVINASVLFPEPDTEGGHLVIPLQ